MKVQTVTGAVDAEKLGKTLIHEHVVAALPGFEIDPRPHPTDDELLPALCTKLERLKSYGVDTVVDATALNWCRRPRLLRDVSERTGVHIVAVTGLYTERMGWPFHIKLFTEDEIFELYMHELTVGMGDTDVRAGLLKCATGGKEVGKYEMRAMRAAARASRAAGVGIITHTELAEGALEQIAVLDEAGADLSRVMVGHCDNSNVPDYHEAIVKTGASIGFDRIGHFMLMPDEDRIASINRLLSKGYERQILLSHDCVAEGLGKYFRTEEDERWKQYGMSYLFEETVPKLAELGVKTATFEVIFNQNPRRILAGA